MNPGDPEHRDTVAMKNREADTVGPYHLGNELGRGYFGRVRKGLNIETGDFVAVKTLSLSAFDKTKFGTIQQEIQTLRNLDHKHIVKYINFLKKRDDLHIILEFVENGSLHDIMKRFGTFPESLIQTYARQIIHALAYLHENGIIHCDIKASNILITKSGECKLADFGTCLNRTIPSPDSVKFSLIGSPYWMSPELMAGVPQEISFPTDIWSLGCTIIELLTGHPPWGKLDPMAALFKLHTESIPQLVEGEFAFSAEMQHFINTCCQREPKNRPTARQLLKHPWINMDERKEPSGPSHPSPVRIKTVYDLTALLEQHQEDLQRSKESGVMRRNTSTIFIDNHMPSHNERGAAGLNSKWVPPILNFLDSEDNQTLQGQHLEALYDRLQQCMTEACFETMPTIHHESKLEEIDVNYQNDDVPHLLDRHYQISEASTGSVDGAKLTSTAFHHMRNGRPGSVRLRAPPTEAQLLSLSKQDLVDIILRQRLTQNEALSIADDLYDKTQDITQAKKRAYHAAYEYKNIAEEAVLDRKMVLLKLKRVQDQWCPSESINHLQQQKRDISDYLKKLVHLEKTISPYVVASHAYGALTVENLRRFHPALQAVMQKQSVKLSISGQNRKSPWKSRLVLLLNNFLIYFKTERDTAPAGVINVGHFRISSMSESDPNPVMVQMRQQNPDIWKIILVIASERVYYFINPGSKQLSSIWKEHIEKSVPWYKMPHLDSGSSDSPNSIRNMRSNRSLSNTPVPPIYRSVEKKSTEYIP